MNIRVRVYDRLPGILDGENDCELVRAIARTVSQTFWVSSDEPQARPFDRYDNLREIAKDLRHRASRNSS